MTAESVVAISAGVVAATQLVKSEQMSPDSAIENLADERLADAVLGGKVFAGDDARSIACSDLDDLSVHQASISVLLTSPHALRMESRSTPVSERTTPLGGSVAIVVALRTGEQVLRAAAGGHIAVMQDARLAEWEWPVRQDVGDGVGASFAPIEPEQPVSEVPHMAGPQPVLAGLVNFRPEALNGITASSGVLAGSPAELPRFDFKGPDQKLVSALCTGARNGRLTGHRSYSYGEPRAVATVPGHSCVNYIPSLRVEIP